MVALRKCYGTVLIIASVQVWLKRQNNSNSQKVVSVNNVIRHCLPKNMTYSRTFSGRAHSAVFKCNNGPGESILRLYEATGCSISSNSKVSAGLLTEQKVSENDKACCRSSKLEEINYSNYIKQNQEKIAYTKRPVASQKSSNKANES